MRSDRAKHRLGSLILSMALVGTSLAHARDHSKAPAATQLSKNSPASQPATNPGPPLSAADAKKAATAAVNNAIAELTKETNAHKKDPKSPLREKSNYFIENKVPEATREEILVAMSKSSLAQDVASDTYIRWQLLSGIQGKIDDKLVSKMLAVYLAAPALVTRPGLDHASRRQLDNQIRNAAQGDAAKINEALQKEVDAATRANAPILIYREDLYAHLPGSGDAIMAGLEDGAARAGAGFDADRHMKGVMAQITTWSVNGTPSQIRSVSSLLKTMIGNMQSQRADGERHRAEPIYADVIGSQVYLAKTPPPAGSGKPAPPKAAFPPSFYVDAEWDAKAKHLVWREGAARFIEVKSLVAMCQQLDDIAAVLAQMKSK